MITKASKFLYGPTDSERIAQQRDEIAEQNRSIERKIEDLERQITRSRTLAENLIHQRKPNESDRHFKTIVDLRRQVAVLEKSRNQLNQLETRLQQTETNALVIRSFSNVSRTLESSSTRTSPELVQSDVMRMKRAEFKLKAANDQIAEAMEYDSDDDSGDDIAEIEQNECAAMKEEAMLRLMPRANTSIPNSSLHSTSALTDLPELRPLSK